MLVYLLGVHGVSLDMCWIVVDVSAEDGLRVVWFYVFSGTAFAMSTGAYFVVE